MLASYLSHAILSLTFAGRYKKISAIADITEIQMHHGSGMSAAGQWNLSQVVPCHSKVFQLSCNMFHCSFADVSLSLSLPSLLPFNTFVELMCEWSVWDLF